MFKRERAVGGSCEGCFFYISSREKGEGLCSKPAIPDRVDLDCVDHDVANPNQFVYYIFKESCNEKQNETMAP